VTDRKEVPDKPDPGRSRRRRPSRWLFEVGIIMASVALGYGAARFEEYQSNRGLADQALAALSSEVEHNRRQLEPMVPMHAAWVSALEHAQQADAGTRNRAALDVWFAARPEFPEGARSSFPLLQRSAWDAALSSGALRFFDYDLAKALADVYRMQETATDNVDRLAQGALSEVAIYDPASRPAAVRLLWLTLADILSAEVLLLELYDLHMPALQAIAPRKPATAAPVD
jgi:hypothetical protein